MREAAGWAGRCGLAYREARWIRLRAARGSKTVYDSSSGELKQAEDGGWSRVMEGWMDRMDYIEDVLCVGPDVARVGSLCIRRRGREST